MTTEFVVSEEMDAEATLRALMDETVAPAGGKQSGRARAAQIAEAITVKDLDELNALQAKMTGIIDQIVANSFDVEDVGQCTDEQLEALMVELLDNKDLKRLAEVRYQMIRKRIFSHLNAVHAANKVIDPEQAPGEVPVPSLGKKFTREGGRVKALLNHDELRERLGEERWAQVCNVEVIPEHTEYHLDETKLMALAADSGREVMDILRQCVHPGARTPQSFHVRNL